AHFWHVELKQSILRDFMVHSPSANHTTHIFAHMPRCAQWLEGRSYAAKHVPTAAAASEGYDPTVLFLMLLQHAREVCQLFGRMKQLCGFDITERAQTELHRKGAAFELVRAASL